LTDYFELYIIELPKAVKEYKSNKEDGMLQWMMFLENPEDAEVGKIMKENEDIKEAKNELERISQDEILRRQLLKAKIARMDAIQREKDARDDGLAEGEKKSKIEIAKKMLEENLPTDMIMKLTGLTKEEIEKIKDNKK
jgi:predicted transposase/invertase (TIGR01784 family)